MGVRFDPGRDADQSPRDSGRPGAFDLLERVEDDERSGGRSSCELFVRLVVPVYDDVLAGDPRRLGEPKLAERRHVGADSLLGKDPHDRDVREGLRPINDGRIRCGLPVAAGGRPQGLLVVDHERAPVRAHELGGRDAAKRENAAVDPGRVGEKLEHRAILPTPFPRDGATLRSVIFILT